MKNISLHKRHQFLRVFGYFPQFCDQTPNEKSLWGGEISGSCFERSQSIKWALAWLLAVATTQTCGNPEAVVDREHCRHELKASSTVTQGSGPRKKTILLTRTTLTPVCWGLNCPSVHLCLLGEAVLWCFHEFSEQRYRCTNLSWTHRQEPRRKRHQL